MTQPNQFPPVTEERLAKARAMLDDHCSVAEVVRTTGLARETINKHIGRRGWSLQECGQFGVVVKQARKAGVL
jgi:ribosomal protein L13E